MDFVTNIKLKQALLTKKEKIACDAILDNLMMVQKYSFTELSEMIHITKPTILRFCKKVGYSGYNEFKYECIKYVNSVSHFNEELELKQDNISRTTKMYAEVISSLDSLIIQEDLNQIVTLLSTCRRIRAIGMINSAVSCWQLRYALLMFGIEIDVVDSVEALKTVDLCFKPNDLTIIFSVSAQNELVHNAIQLSKQSESSLVLVTMNKDNPYKQDCDVHLLLPSLGDLKKQSLLDSVPIYSVFVEILISYYATFEMDNKKQ